MLQHPQIDPVAIALGPLEIHWYGLMYLAAFMLFLWLGNKRLLSLQDAQLDKKLLDDLLFFGVLGVVLGGRLGYVLFYKFDYYAQHPLEALMVWHGGMSFHGGMLGVFVAMAWVAWRRGLAWLKVTDFIAPLVPPGLAMGRLGNFMNGELWGRPSDVPWAMVFPYADKLPRHPSQLYQFALEGVLLFVILWLFASKSRPLGAVSGVFLIGYGSFRFLVEFTREPDSHLGLLALSLSMGQWLSIPMVLIGVLMLIWAYKRRPAMS